MAGSASTPARPALAGWHVLLTKPRPRATAAMTQLAQLGATCDPVPFIAIRPPQSRTPLEYALRRLGEGAYAAIGFTSVNAVVAVRAACKRLGLTPATIPVTLVAAVGAATASALVEWGLAPTLIPVTDHSARGLVECWPEAAISQHERPRVLLPRSDLATDVLPRGLSAQGWQVDDVAAYRTVNVTYVAQNVATAICDGDYGALLLTSGSNVRALVELVGSPHPRTVIIAIGEPTATVARQMGMSVAAVATEASQTGLVTALAEYASHAGAQ